MVNKDKKLADELVNLLMPYAGEGGRNEGAADTLKRLLLQLQDYRNKHVLGKCKCEHCQKDYKEFVGELTAHMT